MRERLILIFCATFLLSHNSNAAEGELVLETGGVQIALASGWELLDQPATYFVQKRARNAERGIAISAGSVSSELPVQQFVVLGAAALMTGSTDAELDALAKQLGIPRSEIDKTLGLEIGKRMLERLKQQSRSMRFELIHTASDNIPGGTRYEIQSKATMVESGQVFYSRQFLLQGATSRDVVTITYASASGEMFKQQDLVDGIRPPASRAPTAEDEAVNYYSQGMEKGKRRDYAGAITDFSKAIELKPDYAEAFLRRGLAKGGLANGPGVLAEVIVDLNKAIELRPDYAEAYYDRAVAKQAKGDFDAAMADYDKAIELKPDYAAAYDRRSKLKKAKGDLTGAQDDANKAGELKPH